MNVLYVSSYCTSTRNNEIQSITKYYNFNFQSRKFHSLLVDGLQKNKCYIDCLSTCSILSRNVNRRILSKKIKENIDKVNFYTLSVIFIPLIQQIHSTFAIYIFLHKWFRENKNGIIMCDTLEVFYSLGVILYCKLHKKKCIAIVTDLPSDAVGRHGNCWIKKVIITIYSNFFNYIINFYSGYVLLTNDMNRIVNKKNKKNIIMEGLVQEDNNSIFEKKYDKRVIIFAGTIEERFGILLLLEAFCKTNNDNYELHIYGQGTGEKMIYKYLNDKRVKFYGVVSNEIILKEERKAWLLINPRLTSYDYVKYSFPSKNMEYMNSGTCVLTTCLPGMPKEYYNYVYSINNETPEYLKEKIEEILSKSDEELIRMGRNAREFVQCKKNNKIQVKRILEMCGKLSDEN